MSTRSTRNQPFCWQEKKILRLLNDNFKKSDLAKYRNLYLSLTQIDSDFNGKPIKFYTKTISKYSGLSVKWIPQGLKKLADFNVIEITDIRDEKKRRTGQEILFTPEKVVSKPILTKPTIRKPIVRSLPPLEDNSLSEDITLGEDTLPPAEIKISEEKMQSNGSTNGKAFSIGNEVLNNAKRQEFEQAFVEMNNAYYFLKDATGGRLHPWSAVKAYPRFKAELWEWAKDVPMKDISGAWLWFLKNKRFDYNGNHNPRVFLNNFTQIILYYQKNRSPQELWADKKERVA